MKRIKLADRQLPDYTRAEEIMNMVTHIVGGALGAVVLALGLYRSVADGSMHATAASIIYGISMITLYTISSVYHGLKPCTGKKVLQVIDHCTIYLLIAGTYTPILVVGFLPLYPAISWSLLALEWGLAILAATLTAIDLRRYRVFSMICYIFMGWAIVFFIPQTLIVMSAPGFAFLLAGGITYTIGAVLYGIGSKIRWFHSVFHIFVVAGSFLQFLSIILYVL